VKVLGTGVNGQLGFDVARELAKRGHDVIGSGSKDMKVFVTGVNGQLGHDVMNDLEKRGHEGVGSDIQAEYSGVADGSAVTTMPYVQLDITDREAVMRAIADIQPDAVIHCAAWTAVDMAEDDDKVEKVRAVNAGGTQNIADACKAVNCKMLYISTDYVFDGQGTRPWQPDDKSYAPLNVYGQTKLEGELAVSQTLEKYFIVRIAWVFGLNGKNFIKTMINVGKTHDTVRVVNDQIGTPTYTFDLARLLVDMIETEKYGYYHATNEGGYISWYDFCCEFYRQCGLKTKVIPVTTAEYGLSKAARPFNSRLDKSKLVEAGFEPLPTWQDAVYRYIKEIEQCHSLYSKKQ
jgi:dTDP-4-dehydrorhamnose reductase